MGKRPNIILMNCDDLGYGDLSCYGSKVNRTPNLDAMAQEGIRFTDFYMASPVCSPSRGGMLTGCYPPRIGFGSFQGQAVLFPGMGVGLSSEETTIADILHDAGYRTKIIGKWHCGDQPEFLPLRHGFDEYYGLPYSNDMGRQIHREQSPPLPLIDGEEILEEQPDQRSLTERYLEQAVRFIRRSKENPFFLYFAHMHVHLPLYAAMPFVERSQNGDYGACVEAVDWTVGAILHELRRQGLQEDTLFIFTSDNGGRGEHGGSNAPLRGMKTTTWEGGQRVPCIMYWPGHIRSGVVSQELLTSMDFLPTFAALCGAAVPQGKKIDGIDCSRLLFEDIPSPRREFFYYRMNDLEAVRTDTWKLHVSKAGVPVRELYNLREDISESRNVYEEHPDIVAQLEKLLEECRADLGDDRTGIQGRGIRPIGQVDNPRPLTQYREDHPYIIQMYDKDEIG